jgi:hypothetical protein
MATGGSQVIGSGTVIVQADDAKFQSALAKLPDRAKSQIDAAMRAIQAQMAKGAADWNKAFQKGDTAGMDALAAKADVLAARLNAVKLRAVEMGDAQDKAAQRAAESAKRQADAEDRRAAAAVRAAADARRREAAELAASRAAEAAAAAREQAARRAAAAEMIEGMALEARLSGYAEEGRLIGQVGTAGGGAAQALFQLGAAVDDAQYGFRGVANNIPMIVMALGGAGLAGAVSIAVTAIYQLHTHSDMLKEKFLGIAPAVNTAADALRRYADQAKNAEKATERLGAKRAAETLGKVQEAGEKAEVALSADEETANRRYREAQERFGGKNVGAALAASDEGQEMLNSSAEVAQVKKEVDERVAKHMKTIRGTGMGMFLTGEQIARARERIRTNIEQSPEIQEKINEAREAAKNRILGEAETGSVPGTRERVAGILEKSKDAAARAAAYEMKRATPEAVKEDREAERRGKLRSATEGLGRALQEKMEAAAKALREQNKAEGERFGRHAAGGAIGRALLENPNMTDAQLKNKILSQMAMERVPPEKRMAQADSAAKAARKAVADRETQLIERRAERGETIDRDEARKRLKASDELRDFQEKMAKQEGQDQVRHARRRAEDAGERVRRLRTEGVGQFHGLTDFAKTIQSNAFQAADRQKELQRAITDEIVAMRDLNNTMKQVDLRARAGP